MRIFGRDAMRVLGWTCVVLGLLVVLVGVVAVRHERGILAQLAATATPARTGALYREADRVALLPWIVGGAGVSAFGILILAIRRPALDS
jgi:hypothetical protein